MKNIPGTIVGVAALISLVLRALTIACFVGLLFYATIILLWMQCSGPAFSHPPLTPQEKRMVKRAIKYHGDYPITREGERGVFVMTIKGKRIEL